MGHILFIWSSADRCLGCFHLWALVNSAAMNMGVPTPVQVSAFIPLWVYPKRNWAISQFPEVELGHMIMLFNVWDLPQCLHHLILPSSAQGFTFPTKDTAFDHPRLTLIIPLDLTNSAIKLSHIPVREDKKKKTEKRSHSSVNSRKDPWATDTHTHSQGYALTSHLWTYTAEGMVTVVSSSTSFSCLSRSASISLSSSSSLVS